MVSTRYIGASFWPLQLAYAFTVHGPRCGGACKGLLARHAAETDAGARGDRAEADNWNPLLRKALPLRQSRKPTTGRSCGKRCRRPVLEFNCHGTSCDDSAMTQPERLPRLRKVQIRGPAHRTWGDQVWEAGGRRTASNKTVCKTQLLATARLPQERIAMVPHAISTIQQVREAAPASHLPTVHQLKKLSLIHI